MIFTLVCVATNNSREIWISAYFEILLLSPWEIWAGNQIMVGVLLWKFVFVVFQTLDDKF